MATGETVTVACKLPNGLLLRLPDESGVEQQVRLRGSAEQRRMESRDTGPIGDLNGRVQGGFGLTHRVPKDFWDKWSETYRKANFAPLVKGLIFAHVKPDHAGGAASDMAVVRNGLEPLDPGKSMNINGTKIEKDTGKEPA